MTARAAAGLATLIIGIAAAGAACSSAGPGPRLDAPRPPDLDVRLAEARTALAKGSYAGFKRAAAIGAELESRPGRKDRERAAEPYLRALILLQIRERQLGIIISATSGRARALIQAHPALKGYATMVDQAEVVSVSRSAGIQTDLARSIPSLRREWTQKDLERMMAEAKAQQAASRAKASGDDFHAYCYLAFNASMAPMREGGEDFSPIFALFPESKLMRYLNAVRSQREKPELLERLAADDPEFHEAWFHLGLMALGQGRLLGAEEKFLKAEAGLPDTPQIPIYLASIYTATEEHEKSLAYYDKALALSPEYRDALLGKAISLASLGRHEESAAVLQRMIELGNWMIGEANYWLAWNRHAQEREAEAQAHIEESKGRLPTSSEVFGLAGTIALELAQPDRAEKEFLKALEYGAGNTEALFGLGRINDGRGRWREAAGYYETASKVIGQRETEIEGKIAEIRAAPMVEPRRAAMLAKKELQLRVTQATRAAGCLNAAVAWFNGGAPEKARPAAEKAAAHPQFKDKALALLSKL
jgi:tetratricopeptide (TPR) repeat protein